MKKFIGLILLIAVVVFVILGLNTRLTVAEYTVSNSRIPSSFDGYKIAVVSDLHAESFGENQAELVGLLRESKADLICLTGDIVSDDTTDFSPVWAMTDAIKDIPMVYVAGNNELVLNDYDLFLSELESHGVTVLDDLKKNTLSVNRGSDKILLHGYTFTDSRHLSGRIPAAEKGCYNILLYHDPYCFDDAALMDYDLMLAGHLHGGVIRLPYFGSPLEWTGTEPYTRGVYNKRASTLIVSGGLGTHDPLPRFYNNPEVVVITLKAK